MKKLIFGIGFLFTSIIGIVGTLISVAMISPAYPDNHGEIEFMYYIFNSELWIGYSFLLIMFIAGLIISIIGLCQKN